MVYIYIYYLRFVFAWISLLCLSMALEHGLYWRVVSYLGMPFYLGECPKVMLAWESFHLVYFSIVLAADAALYLGTGCHSSDYLKHKAL